MKMIYLTDGEARNIKIGKNTIVFKPAIPKKLAAKGKLSSLVIQALQELGKERITESVLNRLTEVLQQEDPAIIRSDAKLAPAWIARLLYTLTEKMEA